MLPEISELLKSEQHQAVDTLNLVDINSDDSTVSEEQELLESQIASRYEKNNLSFVDTLTNSIVQIVWKLVLIENLCRHLQTRLCEISKIVHVFGERICRQYRSSTIFNS